MGHTVYAAENSRGNQFWRNAAISIGSGCILVCFIAALFSKRSWGQSPKVTRPSESVLT